MCPCRPGCGQYFPARSGKISRPYLILTRKPPKQSRPPRRSSTGRFCAADRSPYSRNMDYSEYPDVPGFEARFSACGYHRKDTLERVSACQKSLFDTLWQFFKLFKSLKNWLIERERRSPQTSVTRKPPKAALMRVTTPDGFLSHYLPFRNRYSERFFDSLRHARACLPFCV